jgi:hypothetical protein
VSRRDLQIGHQWKVIGSDQRRAAPEDVKVRKLQGAIEIDVIEIEDWEHARISAGFPQVAAKICSLQMGPESSRYRTTEPLVKVSQDDPRTSQVIVTHDAILKELPCLFPVFKERCAEVDVENMKRRRPQQDVGTQASAGFTATRGDVVVAIVPNRKPGENHVPVAASLMDPVFPERKVVSEFFRKEAGLILIAIPAIHAHNFLERNDICVDFPENFGDSARADPPVQASTFVDVVSGDAYGTSGCSHCYLHLRRHLNERAGLSNGTMRGRHFCADEVTLNS